MTNPAPRIPALEAAVALARAPSLAHGMRLRPLPEGAALLLAILARRSPAVAQGRAATGFSEEHLLDVIESWVFQVMLFRGATPHRILGVTPGMDRAFVRRQFRDLLEWLHPDKSNEPWREPFAARVIDAWRRLERGDDAPAEQPLHRRISPRLHRMPLIAVPAPLPSPTTISIWQRARFTIAALAALPMLSPSVAEGHSAPRPGCYFVQSLNGWNQTAGVPSRD